MELDLFGCQHCKWRNHRNIHFPASIWNFDLQPRRCFFDGYYRVFMRVGKRYQNAISAPKEFGLCCRLVILEYPRA